MDPNFGLVAQERIIDSSSDMCNGNEILKF